MGLNRTSAVLYSELHAFSGCRGQHARLEGCEKQIATSFLRSNSAFRHCLIEGAVCFGGMSVKGDWTVSRNGSM